ncbi:hypothetical protein [Paraburkholderia acidipaludis]|uniref:hypothetical protein n=1 Tax=Paraburkholderia acidipaludis TaxID=660537 RepID=UPI0004810534|nr:hypothetical protein [Paraburkholderia acidipaludis]
MQLGDTCYCCGEPAVGPEHFPPESFFPVGRRSGLIEVPACKKHNQDKSRDDEYIRTMLMYDIRAHGVGHVSSVRDTSRRALERSFGRSLDRLENGDPDGAKVEEVRRRLDGLEGIAAMKELDALVNEGLVPSSLHALATKNPEPVRATLPSGQEVETISTEIDVDRVIAYFSLGARALYYWAFNTRFVGQVILAPHFLMPTYHPDDAKQLEYFESLFDRDQSIGDQKEYFYYRVIDGADANFSIDGQAITASVLNFCMYDIYKTTAIFVSPQQQPYREGKETPSSP